MSDTLPRTYRQPSFRGQIGIARTDITPPVGIYSRNWGAAAHDVADSIHRSLTLTALTLSTGPDQPPLVLVDADLGWWRGLDVFRRFQKQVLDALDLEVGQLIFALSHTHAGPPLMDADEALPGCDILKTWMEELPRATIATVREALADPFDGIIDWTTGRCTLATVRDLPDPDPKVDRFLCGYSPEGEPDDTLIVGRITDSAGQMRATLVNYACHPTTLAWDNTAISPDYIGAMRQTMQDVTGAPAMFLLGACGELAPRYQYVGDTDVADRHGRQLGYAALGALNDMEPPATQLEFDGPVESGAPLAVWKHRPATVSQELRSLETTVELKLKDWPSADELERQRLACEDRALEERLRRRRNIRLGLGDGETFDLPLYAWRIGDAVLVGCCCESYSMLQQELRRWFPERTVLVVNLINGTIGYLPPAERYDSDVYPVWQTPFDRGGLEATIEGMERAIRDVLSD
ncbi:MAG: alkaline ceramidase [Maioricimonas sp. JB045]